jgi:hypothetical protein
VKGNGQNVTSGQENDSVEASQINSLSSERETKKPRKQVRDEDYACLAMCRRSAAHLPRSLGDGVSKGARLVVNHKIGAHVCPLNLNTIEVNNSSIIVLHQ